MAIPMLITSMVARSELAGWFLLAMPAGALPRKRRKLVLIAFSPFRIKFKRKVLKFPTKDEALLSPRGYRLHKVARGLLDRTKEKRKRFLPFLFLAVPSQRNNDPRYLIAISLSSFRLSGSYWKF